MPATSTSLALTYVAVALTGAADAVCQGSLFGVVAPMPERFTQALMGGTSFSGLVVSALRVVSKAAFAGSADGARGGAVAYFAVSALWVGACLGIFAHLERTPVFQYHRRKHARERARESDRGDCAPDGPDVAEAASALLAAVDVLPPLPPIPRVEPTTTYQHYVRDLDVDADVDDAPPLAAG